MGQYKKDEADGVWRQWNEDGQQTREKEFDADAAAESSIDLFSDEDTGAGESIDFEMAEDGSIKSMLDGDDTDSDSNDEDDPSLQGTDSLEDISPAEMESEELPSPANSADEDSSAIRMDDSGGVTDEQVDRFFQIGF